MNVLILFLLLGTAADLCVGQSETARSMGNRVKDLCKECIRKTKQGTRIVETLLYYTYKPECNNTRIEPCISNQTQYSRCYTKQGIQCYEPKAVGPITGSIYVYGYKGGTEEIQTLFTHAQSQGGYIAHNQTRGKQKISVCFDTCRAISIGQGHNDEYGVSCRSYQWERDYVKERKYLFQMVTPQASTGHVAFAPSHTYWYTEKEPKKWSKGPTGFNISMGSVSTDCSSGQCTPICLETSVPQTSSTQYYYFGIGIDGTGKDPYGYIIIQVKSTKLSNQPVKVFWEYEEEITKINQLPVPPKAKNMFIELAQEVANKLILKNCFVCGGTNMGDEWPWHAREANYTEIQQWNKNFTYSIHFNETWRLSINLVGNVCYTRANNSGRTRPMGYMRCLNEWENNTWTSQINETQPKNNSLSQIEQLSFLKDPENDTLQWITPDGLYWICGAFAYNILPAGWFGSCILGVIQPSFFLLPIQRKQLLGIPVYESVGRIVKREINDFSCLQRKWKYDEWPPERIICEYGPATWAQDGSWGYRTPIYMLNRIIRLQAVVEIITNQTARALTKLARESVLSRTYIMQNRLALDYLLAKEGGVCGKFNLTNCCIQIDGSGTVVEQITTEMIKIAHVPVQTWHGLLDKEGFLGGIFANWKQALFMGCITIIGLMMLPCLIPVIRSIVQSSIEGMMKTQTSIKSMMVLKEIENQIQLLEGMETIGPMKESIVEKGRLIEIQKNIKQIAK